MQRGHLSGISDYWTARAHGFSVSVEEEIETGRYQHWLDIILKQIKGRKDMDILDVGTGPGFFPVILGREGYRVTGIDCTEAMIEQARENCTRYSVDAKFEIMDAQNLTFPDSSFDLVISRNVVWNLDDPVRAYSEWLRVLRPGGLLMVFDGNHYLFLYDNEYRALDEDRGMGRIKEHAHMEGVDPTIIEDIARELPMSSERRPQWDVNTLIEMGVQMLHVSTDGRDSFHLVKDGKDIYLPFSFFVCATK